jgi:hypothetical protein
LKTPLAAEINVSRTDIWLWDEADALTAKSSELARINFFKIYVLVPIWSNANDFVEIPSFVCFPT